MDILFSFGPLNTKYTDKKSTGPQDTEGLKILPWGVAGEAGSASGREEHRESPSPACQYAWQGHQEPQDYSVVMAGTAQAMNGNVFQPSTRKNYFTQGRSNTAWPKLLCTLSSWKISKLKWTQSWESGIWTQSQPCLGFPSTLSYTVIPSPSVLSGLWKAKEGSAPPAALPWAGPLNSILKYIISQFKSSEKQTSFSLS